MIFRQHIVPVDPSVRPDGSCWSVVYRSGAVEVKRERYADKDSAIRRAHSVLQERAPYTIHLEGPTHGIR
ncbi:hypothetical protein ACVIJW_000273 [Bradyrhizobium barranii subsp. barranii]